MGYPDHIGCREFYGKKAVTSFVIYSVGIIAALHTEMSDVAHTPSISLEPGKKVELIGCCANSLTTSFLAKPLISAHALPIDFLHMCLLALRHCINWSPSSCHFVSWATRSSLNLV
jgi:hypothetical protein